MVKHSNPHTIVLAYSGGLDTSIIVPWLKENYAGARVICVAADIGQGSDELAGVRAKAIASGAEECYVEDLRDEFAESFIFPTLRAGAKRGEDERFREFVAQIFDVALFSAGSDCLGAHAGKLVATLANVGGDADDARARVVLLEPGNDDRGIESA